MTDTPCRVTAELRDYEQEEYMNDRNYEMFKDKATDDLVWRVMENEEGRPFDLVDFLAEQKDLPELMTRQVLTATFSWTYDEIEKRLRAKLADSEAVEERAAEMARGE